MKLVKLAKVCSDVSEEHTAFIIKIIESDSGGWQPTRLAFLSAICDRVILAQAVIVTDSPEAMLSVRVLHLW